MHKWQLVIILSLGAQSLAWLGVAQERSVALPYQANAMTNPMMVLPICSDDQVLGVKEGRLICKKAFQLNIETFTDIQCVENNRSFNNYHTQCSQT
jgi:hypothetical protein